MFFFLTLFLSCENSFEYEYQYKDYQAGEQEEPMLLVRSEKAFKGDISNYLQLTGTLESNAQASVIPETNGTCLALYVREGDFVEAGAPLAQLSNRSLDAVEERAELELSRAEREFEKLERLHKQGIVSSREYQEAEIALKTARTSYTEANKNKSSTTVRSPLKGVVTSVSLRQGEQAGGQPAFVIMDPENLRLVASVPERDLNTLHKGLDVEIFAAYDENLHTTGVVERIGPVVDPQTGSIQLFIELPPQAKNPSSDQNKTSSFFRPGQFVRAEIELKTHHDATLISKSALIYQDGQHLVFVMKDPPPKSEVSQNDHSEQKSNSTEDSNDKDSEDSTNKELNNPKDNISPLMAFQQEVSLGYTNAQHVEILEGIEVGEDVITEGNTNLRNKTLVYTPQMKAAAEANFDSQSSAAITSGSEQQDEGLQEKK